MRAAGVPDSGSADPRAQRYLVPVNPEDVTRQATASTLRPPDAEVATVPEAPASPESELRRGVSIGRFVMIDRLGAGAMGEVVLAYDPDLHRRVAIKVLRAGLFSSSGDAAVQRMLREARAMAKLSHPNVITVFEVDQMLSGQSFIAMEFIDGGTLREWRAKAPSWQEVVDVYAAAGEGLAAAHDQDLVHRDFKPDNVLMEGDRACVGDFGLARAAESESVPATEHDESTLAGTPAYMAPEQTSSAAADQYGLCVALWEGLFGVLPFEDDPTGTPRTGRAGANVPLRVRRVLERGLQPDPQRRFPSVRALLETLEQAARPRPWGFLAVAVAGVVASAAGWAAESDPCARLGESWETGWNTQERQRLRADFEKTGAPYAAQSFERFERRIDDYASRWADAATEVCAHPARPHAEQKRRCLDSAQAQAFSLLEALREPDRDQLVVALRSAMRLPSIIGCNSTRWRFESDALADASKEVDELEVLLTLQSPALAERIPAVQARVEALGHPGLRARLAFVQGMANKAQLQPEAALERFRAAARLAMAADLPHELFNAAFQLAMTEAQQGRFDWAEHWQGILDALAERMGPRSRFAASAISQQGFLHQLRSEYQLARESLRQAHDLYVSEEFPDPTMRIYTKGQLAIVLGKLGEHDEAIHLLEELVTETRALYGDESPAVGSAVGKLALVYSTAGDLDASLAAWDESIRIVSRARGEDHMQAVLPRAERAILLLRIEPARSLAPLEAALETVGGAASKRPITFFLRDGIARAHARVGDHAQAISGWTGLLADMEQLESTEIGMGVHIQLGLELVRHENVDDARAHLARAAELATSLPDLSGPSSTEIAVAGAALSLLEGSPQPETLETAIATYEQEGRVGPELAFAKFVLARTLANQGRNSQQVALLRKEALDLANAHDRVLAKRILAWQE